MISKALLNDRSQDTIEGWSPRTIQTKLGRRIHKWFAWDEYKSEVETGMRELSGVMEEFCVWFGAIGQELEEIMNCQNSLNYCKVIIL